MKTILLKFKQSHASDQSRIREYLESEQSKGEKIQTSLEGGDLHITFSQAKQEERLSIFLNSTPRSAAAYR